MTWINQLLLDSYKQVLEQVANSLKSPTVITGRWLPNKTLRLCANGIIIGVMSHSYHFEKAQSGTFEYYTGAWQFHVQFEPVPDYWSLTKLIG